MIALMVRHAERHALLAKHHLQQRHPGQQVRGLVLSGLRAFLAVEVEVAVVIEVGAEIKVEIEMEILQLEF